MRKAKHVIVMYHCNSQTNGKYRIYNITSYNSKMQGTTFYQYDSTSSYVWDNVHDMIDEVIILLKNNNYTIEPYSTDFSAKWYPIEFINLDEQYPVPRRYGYREYD